MRIRALHTLIAALLCAAASPALSGGLPADDIRDALSHADDYGFIRYIEIDADHDERNIEIEGWLDETWRAEIKLSTSGDRRREERSRHEGGSWGMTLDQVHAAIDTAEAQGMVTFEDIKVDRRGRIEVEGEDREGRDLGLYIADDTGEVTRVERD
ncbi:PepSY domain-containing protein [Isoalcanivorax indicus]|uniref:PepSY domain-containing protein n=1 Tax=Isoalcanivorax indicus TaxID=2202653 RepID=UPI000DBAD1B5|nr:PepSY domain-containing protein [Isoalcanivorax indicus]